MIILRPLFNFLFLFLLSGVVKSETLTLNVLYNLSAIRFQPTIAQAFMKLNPEIKINFLAPAANYHEGHQHILRAAVTNTLPDVYFSAYNLIGELVHKLAPRNQILDLDPLIAAEGGQAFLDKNFTPNIAALGQVDGKHYGLPVNASSPIMFINADLVEKTGGHTEHMPDTWKGVVALAHKIHDSDPEVAGMSYDIESWPDDWLWQALLFQAGGRLVDPVTHKIAFDNEIGLNALTLTRAFVTEGGQNFLDWDQSRQQFAAGKTGFIFSTPAQVRMIKQMVGERFQLKTAIFPIDDKEKGGVPTGGNAVVILTSDKSKQAAAWKYAKFLTGPVAQNIIVPITGYIPTNKRTTGREYLGPFYAKHPNFSTAAKQADRSLAWTGYPGGNSVRIWRMQRDIIDQVMRGQLTPQKALTQMVQQTNAMIQ